MSIKWEEIYKIQAKYRTKSQIELIYNEKVGIYKIKIEIKNNHVLRQNRIKIIFQ